VTDPEALRAVDALSAHLGALPEVGKAVSVADPLRQLHGGFLEDPSRPLPDGLALTEQYMLLLASVESMRDLVTDGREAANILLRVDNNGSKPIRELERKVDAWWQANGVEGFSARTTGTMQVFAQSEDDIAYGQLEGLFYALGGIGGILLLRFRRPLLVGIALLANFTPVALLFGLMGLAGIPLDAGTVLVGSIALGIAVDDTIHVISGFHGRRCRGATRHDALESAYELVLPPLVYTTVAVSLGFLVLGVSPFQFTRNLGLLTAAVMAVCLISNVTLLPALLARLRSYAR
jgi:predicted RND superfamily exporter protein